MLAMEGRGERGPCSFLLGPGHLHRPRVEKRSLALGFLTEPWGPGAWSLFGGSLGLRPPSVKDKVIRPSLQGRDKGQRDLDAMVPPHVCSWFPLPETHPSDEQMLRRRWSQASPPRTLLARSHKRTARTARARALADREAALVTLDFMVMMDGLSGRQAEAIGRQLAECFHPQEAGPGLCPAFDRGSQAPGETTQSDRTCWGTHVIPEREGRLEGARAGAVVPRTLGALGPSPASDRHPHASTALHLSLTRSSHLIRRAALRGPGGPTVGKPGAGLTGH